MERVVFVPWERVSLVITEKQDFEVMYKAINNVNILKNLNYIKHNTKETEEKFLNEILDKASKFFVIMLNETKEIIGSVAFNEFDDISRNWLIWITLYDESKMWKWYWTEAMNLFLKYAFEYLWYHKVRLNVFGSNLRAKKSYEKSWFRTVWVFKDEVYVMWKYEDSIAMELLRSEWEKFKTK